MTKNDFLSAGEEITTKKRVQGIASINSVRTVFQCNRLLLFMILLA